MPEAAAVADDAVNDARVLWQDSGLTEVFSELVNAVWTKNVDRYEPVELGDDASTLGYNCSRNLGNRTLRCVAGTDHGSFRWDIDGLMVDLPHGALRLSLAGRRFYVMKAPPAHGLTPDWNSFVNWDNESNTRQELAEATRTALEGYVSPSVGQPGLWPFEVEATSRSIRDFMVVWAGQQTPVTTAGWMTLPIHGATPFAAVGQLWSPRQTTEEPVPTTPQVPAGPSFELKPDFTPTITLRRRGSQEQS